MTGLAGVPFRETHHISGAAVKLAEDKGCQLSDLTTQDLQGINKLFEDDVQEVWNFNRCACLAAAVGTLAVGVFLLCQLQQPQLNPRMIIGQQLMVSLCHL